MLQSVRYFNRLLYSAIATCTDGFFVIIPFKILGGSKNPVSLFIYFDGKKICASFKFIGKSDYKSFNKFINRTLSDNSVSSKKIWAPKNYISKKTQEIWGYQNIEFILYSNYAKNVPELLRLIRTNIKNLYLSNPFNELNNIVKSVNTMINPLMLSTQSLNGAMEIVNNSNKTIKRMYSTLVSKKNVLNEGCKKWKSFKTENFSVLDNSQIEKFVTSFWNEVVVPETTGNTTLKMAIQLRVQLNNMGKLEISQDKWVREWNKGSISILSQIYTLSATENKRCIIWDSLLPICHTKWRKAPS